MIKPEIWDEAITRAEHMFEHTGTSVKWPMIGHLQRNIAKKTVQLFDMIQTIDSKRIAKAVNRHCRDRGKNMPTLVEINRGRESNKTGAMPKNINELITEISPLPKLRI